MPSATFNLVLFLGLLVFIEPASGTNELRENFDEATLSAFGKALLSNPANHLLTEVGQNQTRALKTNYVGYDRGSKRVSVYHNILPSQHYSLRFAVRFCDGFDFALGGKLHGLGPKKPVTGGSELSPNGWSARLMFRKNGGLQTYVYHQNMKKKFGDGKVAKGFRFVTNKYYELRMDVKLNRQSTKPDGAISVFVNGEKVIQHNGLLFNSQDHKDGLISKVLFNTFHGGSAPEWAPRTNDGEYKTDCAYFDTFVLSPEVLN